MLKALESRSSRPRLGSAMAKHIDGHRRPFRVAAYAPLRHEFPLPSSVRPDNSARHLLLRITPHQGYVPYDIHNHAVTNRMPYAPQLIGKGYGLSGLIV